MTAPRPQDPADRATDAKADGAFGGGLTNHRAGYGDDRLARLVDYLRRNPRATLASGEGALLLAEIDRLRDDVQKQADWADWAKDELERLTSILAALREPSAGVVGAAALWITWTDKDFVKAAIRAAVAAAKQEVGNV